MTPRRRGDLQRDADEARRFWRALVFFVACVAGFVALVAIGLYH